MEEIIIRNHHIMHLNQCKANHLCIIPKIPIFNHNNLMVILGGINQDTRTITILILILIFLAQRIICLIPIRKGPKISIAVTNTDYLCKLNYLLWSILFW
jgi:hypothetical protein